jgi:hypothetical protein
MLLFNKLKSNTHEKYTINFDYYVQHKPIFTG